ncbi:MAG: yegE, partial [Gammaproteobacteria bacterium]|nr:yegE [Gammaproteobacteria bacterium]
MLIAQKPDNEQSRLASLRALEVLDSAPEAQFNTLVRSASLLTGTPVSLLSLIDSGRQWFKANTGLPGVTETSRDVAFCAHTILQDEVLEIPDARRDPRFADNPLVTGSA